jgi:prepilin-type N-terminal cleavage/methylation domain-containing protein
VGRPDDARAEAGFTLIEVLLATALFAFVGLSAFETLRQLGTNVVQLAQRATARTQLAVALARLRSDAVSAVAIWKPAAGCGDAVAFLQRDAAGTQFVIYRERANALIRTAGAAPLDPCDPALPVETLVAGVTAFTVASVAASALPGHVDPVSGAADGAMFIPAGIAAVAVDAHAQDADGSPIRAGNGVVEVTVAADPRWGVVDLVAGSRPSAYTHVLRYACGARCAANGPFPEVRGGSYTSCSAAIDFAQSPLYYVPATVVTEISGGAPQFRVTAYWVTGAYTFAFAGADATTARRTWTPARWPPAGAVVDDPYPVDYANNAVAARTPAQIASDLDEPSVFATELTDCGAMNADTYFAD